MELFNLEGIALLKIFSYLIYLALGILSIYAIGTGAFKIIQFWRVKIGAYAEAEEILDDWLNGRADAAIKAAEKRHSVLSRVLQAVFSGFRAKPNDPSYAEELSRQTATIELASLSERMRTLDMIVQAAPMLGLLGTVVGMIDAFSVLAVSEGAVNPALLASGIYVAMTTTAIGLAVALIAFFLATWFESRIDKERTMMEALISAAIHGRVDPNSKIG